jgi:putative acyl-CoA dehydrogenase
MIALAKDWLPKITARHYDEHNIPWFEKEAITIGMAMTEKQGGSDVRANTTKAIPTQKSLLIILRNHLKATILILIL